MAEQTTSTERAQGRALRRPKRRVSLSRGTVLMQQARQQAARAQRCTAVSRGG